MNEIQNQTPTPLTQDQILAEVLENSRKTKAYMKWQLYITLILVVLPLLAAVFLVPVMISNLSQLFNTSGIMGY